jgi:tetratricopeptide (TPR) repeat protein
VTLPHRERIRSPEMAGANGGRAENAPSPKAPNQTSPSTTLRFCPLHRRYTQCASGLRNKDSCDPNGLGQNPDGRRITDDPALLQQGKADIALCHADLDAGSANETARTCMAQRGYALVQKDQAEEVRADHCTEAEQIEKAAGLWGKAGQRSLLRSAFVEAIAQVTRALTQISDLSATPALRRQQIRFQIALVYALMNTKGYAASETTAALEQARLLIDRAEAFGEPSDNPLLLFRLFEGFWLASYVAFNGDAMRDRAGEFLTLAEKQGAIVPLLMGHRLMGVSLMWTGDIAEGRTHFDQAIALCDHVDRPLATGIAKDYWVSTLSDRSLTLWTLGYPEAALADAQRAVKDARDLGRGFAHAVSITSIVFILCGDYVAANAQSDEAIAWADEKGSVFWKAFLTIFKGWALALTGKASGVMPMLTSGIAAWRSTGSTVAMPTFLSHLAMACADDGQFDAACRSIDEAVAATRAQPLFQLAPIRSTEVTASSIDCALCASASA